jgi:hypothetical protein
VADNADGGYHQGPLDPAWPQVLFLLCMLGVCAASLGEHDKLSSPARAGLRLFAAAAVLGFIVAIVHTALGSTSPHLLVMAMPCRLLNLAVLAALVVLLGRLWTLRAEPLAAGVLVAFVAVAVGVRWLESPIAALLTLRAAALAGLGAVVVRASRTTQPGRLLAAASLPLGGAALDGYVWGDREVGLAAGGTLIALALLAARGGTVAGPMRSARLWPDLAALAIGVGAAVQIAARPRAPILDYRPDAVLTRAASGKGMLLAACGLVHAQRLTRRPILLDTEQLDMLAYVLEAAPATDHILQRVYGRRLLEQPTLDCRVLWESRTAEEWARLAAELHFTEILTFPDWRMQLNEAARSESYALYRLPAR